MNVFEQLFQNRVLLCGVVAWAAAQVLKVLINLAMEKMLNLKRLIGMGGMPSSHTSFVFSVCLMTGLKAGFDSVSFAVAFTLMAVVIYDAMGVRAETGKQGAVINRILREFLMEGKPITEDKLKELVGHTPLEVLGGLIVGIVVVMLMA